MRKLLKTHLIIAALAVVFAGCGKDGGGGGGGGTPAGACASVDGLGSTWYDNGPPSGDYLTLRADCTGSTTYCQYAFTYTPPDGVGNTTINIGYTNNSGGCMGTGTHACTAILTTSNQLDIDCGVDGAWTYTR